MSEPKLISPLLDHFLVGESISEHHGVRCYPAVREDSREKYIVKVISVPASQVQLDALLLSGAYQNKEAAVSYFKELADSAAKEAEILQDLARLDGFSCYEDWQVVPMDDGSGYQVYLLGPYHRTLEKHMSRSPMTHLGAVNLGLDLCAALAVSRRAGYLYVDLKPGNIFIKDQTYRIGDLGFIHLDSLKYASLPDRYRSAYTAPEIQDAYSAISPTMDIYALGLVLYQIYNNGVLPFEGSAPGDPLPPPENADYEMAEIILKACQPNPVARWLDPMQMGQALVGYMQRNGVNDTPIVPPAAVPEPEPEEAQPEEEAEPTVDEIVDSIEATVQPELPAEDVPAEEAPAEEPAEADETPAEEVSEEAPADESDEEAEEEDIADLSFMNDLTSDDTAPAEEDVDALDQAAISDETSEILAQVDELISHEAPTPVIAPEPVEIPMPDPIVPEEESQEPTQEELDALIPEPEEEEEEASEEVPSAPEEEPEEEDPEEEQKPAKSKKWIGWVCAILILLGIGAGCYYGYLNYYLQNVAGMEVSGFEDKLTVVVDTEIPSEKLTVFCTDTYGNSLSTALVDGSASFQELKPATQYTVSVVMEGFHKLVGTTSKTYTTEDRTQIVSFTAITGSEDGSVILNFTVDGPEPDQWQIVCSADGEEERTVEFSGHMVTIEDLTVGKQYTFSIVPPETLYLIGNDEITHTASKVLLAKNPQVVSSQNGQITVTWEEPAEPVERWKLHCTNGADYDQTLETTELSAVFTGIDSENAYTVEITAAGMTKYAQTSITANPITITDVLADPSAPSRLYLQWGYEGPDPVGGWTVTVRADGSEPLEVLHTEENSAVVSALIPGASYTFEFVAADETTVFNKIFTYEAPAAQDFEGYWVSAENIYFYMCKTPEKEGWDRYDLDTFTTTFAPEEKASFLIYLDRSYDTSRDNIVTMFVIRNGDGVPVIVDTVEKTWTEMWYKRYCEMEIPAIPSTPGSYTVEIYFNGMTAGSEEFTIES